MSTFIAPSHHLYFNALYRRQLWLSHLSNTYVEDIASKSALENDQWKQLQKRLDPGFTQKTELLTEDDGLGIRQELPLSKLLDDTPIDSFLINFSDSLTAYEQNFFGYLKKSQSDSSAKALRETSLLWGRELAQECILQNPLLLERIKSMKGLFELFLLVLQGGDFEWRPLLVRRYTESRLEYELRCCPHERFLVQDGADLACQLEASVFQGFTEALVPQSNFIRQRRSNYCMDALVIEDIGCSRTSSGLQAPGQRRASTVRWRTLGTPAD